MNYSTATTLTRQAETLAANLMRGAAGNARRQQLAHKASARAKRRYQILKAHTPKKMICEVWHKGILKSSEQVEVLEQDGKQIIISGSLLTRGIATPVYDRIFREHRTFSGGEIVLTPYVEAKPLKVVSWQFRGRVAQ